MQNYNFFLIYEVVNYQQIITLLLKNNLKKMIKNLRISFFFLPLQPQTKVYCYKHRAKTVMFTT